MAENIAYGREDASTEEIIAAAKAAHAHRFIRRMKDGYDTYIQEEGGNLSQGQKQLLCIARVMLNLPPMLILDEATSSIDTRTEVKIQEAFQRMMEGRVERRSAPARCPLPGHLFHFLMFFADFVKAFMGGPILICRSQDRLVWKWTRLTFS